MQWSYLHRYPILDPVFQVLLALGFGFIVGGLTLLLEPLLVIAVVLGVVAFLISLRRPELVLLATILFTSTIIEEDNIPVAEVGLTLYITDVFVLGMLALAVARWLVWKKIEFRITAVDVLIALFLVWAYVATFIGFARGTVDLRTLLGPLRSVSYFGVYFVIKLLKFDRSQLKTLMRGIYLLAFIVSLAIILQYIVGPDVRIFGGRVETLNTGGQIYEGIIRITDFAGEVLVLFAFISKSIVILWGKTRNPKAFDLIQWTLMAVALIVIFNRNYWIGAGVAISIFAVISGDAARRRFFKWALAVVLLGLIGLALIFLSPQNKIADLVIASTDRVGSLFQFDTYRSESTSTFRWRNFEYPYAFEVVADNPITGIGLGAKYRPLVQGIDSIYYDGRAFIHNAHVAYMYQIGLVGYGFLVMVSIISIYRGFKYWKKVDGEELQAIVLGNTLTFVSIFLASVTTPILTEFLCIPLIGIMWGVNEVAIHDLVSSSSDKSYDEQSSPQLEPRIV